MYQRETLTTATTLYTVYECKECQWREVTMIFPADGKAQFYKFPDQCPRCKAPNPKMIDTFEADDPYDV